MTSTMTTITSKICTPGMIENRRSKSGGHELHGRGMAALFKVHIYSAFVINNFCSEIKCVLIICKTKHHLSPNNIHPFVVFGRCKFKRKGPNLTIVVFYNISPGKYRDHVSN